MNITYPSLIRIKKLHVKLMHCSGELQGPNNKAWSTLTRVPELQYIWGAPVLLGTRPFYDLLNRIDVLETNEITSELRLNQTKKICQSKSAGVSCTSRKQRWTHNLCAPRNDPNIISKSTTDSWDAPFYMSKYQYQRVCLSYINDPPEANTESN